jgi:hypothetical protein
VTVKEVLRLGYFVSLDRVIAVEQNIMIFHDSS